MGSHYNGSNREILVLDAWIKLSRALDTVKKQVVQPIREHGLTMAQFGVLELLFHLGPQCQKTIGQKRLTTGGNITQIVDNLVTAGLVVRKTDPDDRRFTRITLTGKGRDRITSAFESHLESLLKAFQPLPNMDLMQLAGLSKTLGTGQDNPENQIKKEKHNEAVKHIDSDTINSRVDTNPGRKRKHD